MLQFGFWKAEVTHTLSKPHLLPCCSLPSRNDRSGKMGSIDQLPVSSQNWPHGLPRKVSALRHGYRYPGPVSHPPCEFSGKKNVTDFYLIHFISPSSLQGLFMVFPALIHSTTPFLLLCTVRGSQVTVTSADYFSARLWYLHWYWRQML